jgi:hypothetical protein
MNSAPDETAMECAAGTPCARDLWILALLLAFPSTGFVQKYAGMAGVAAYIALVGGMILLAARFAAPITGFIERNFRRLTVLTVTGLLGCHLILHPHEDGRGPGKSSDRDEGLEFAVIRMTQGKNPYYPPNDIAGPLSVLPGAIILSAPFVAIGKVGLQNWFWLGVFLWISIRHFKNRALALLLWVVALAISPAAQYEYVSGGDMIANGIYVAVFLWLAIACWTSGNLKPLPALGTCLLLAIGLASRANFILLLPLLGALIWRQSGLKKAITACGLVVILYAFLVVPFYMIDPEAFTPLKSRNKIAALNHFLPWADKAIIGMTLLSVVVSAFLILRTKTIPSTHRFFRYCTLVTLMPMLCAVIAYTLSRGFPDFRFMHDRFGLMYVFFALLGWGGSLKINTEN